MKPIKLSETIKEKLIAEFTKSINNMKLSNDTLQFTAKINSALPKNITKPSVYFTAEAYLKMMLYVRDTSTEIAWHGTVEHDKENNTFCITDVFLYPQKLTAATVETDQAKYNNWIINLDDDTHNTLRFQGHSHVNFAANPSGTDLSFYNDILQVLQDDEYYIFMILNKSGDFSLFIYDLSTNIIYEKEDIDIYILTENTTDLLNDIKISKTENCEVPRISSTSFDYSKYSTSHLRNTTDYDDLSSDTDSIFETIDKRWRNATLKTNKYTKRR